MSDSIKYKITKNGEERWEKWHKASKMVKNEGWSFVMNGSEYVCCDAAMKAT